MTKLNSWNDATKLPEKSGNYQVRISRYYCETVRYWDGHYWLYGKDDFQCETQKREWRNVNE